MRREGVFHINALQIFGPYPSEHAASIGGPIRGLEIVGPVASLTEAMEQRPELFQTPDPYTGKLAEGQVRPEYKTPHSGVSESWPWDWKEEQARDRIERVES